MMLGPEPPVPVLDIEVEVELEDLPPVPVLEVEPVLVVWLPAVPVVVAEVPPQAMSASTGAAMSEVFKAMCMRVGLLVEQRYERGYVTA